MAARRPAGPFAATCPTRELLDPLADKWSVLLLIALADGPVRFNALKRQVEGIMQKTLGRRCAASNGTASSSAAPSRRSPSRWIDSTRDPKHARREMS